MAIPTLDRVPQCAPQREASVEKRTVGRIVDIENNWNTRWRGVSENPVIHESVGVGNSRAQNGSGKRRGLCDIEVVIDQRFDHMIGKIRSPRIYRAASRAIAVLRDCKSGAGFLLREWNVLNLL